MKQNPGGLVVLGLALSAAFSPIGNRSVLAATESWTGSASANWNSSGNWTGTNTPPLSGDSLTFGTSSTTTLNNDLTDAAFSVAGITFASGASAYTINGNSFGLTSAGIVNSSGTNQTFNTGIALLSGGVDTIINNGKILTLGGGISYGTSRLTQQTTAGTVVLNGAGTGSGYYTAVQALTTANGLGINYTYRTSLNSSVVEVGNANPFGSGGFYVAGSTTLRSNTALTGANAIGTAFVLNNTFTIGGTNNIELSGTSTSLSGGGSAGAIVNSGYNNGMTISNSGTTTISGKISLSESSSTGRTLTITNSGVTVLSGSIVDFVGSGAGTAGSLTKGSTGVMTISGSNTYTGVTSMSAGAVKVGSLNSVATNPSLGTVHSASSNLGAPTTVANGTIKIGNAGTLGWLWYTGSGETTDRVLDFASTTGNIYLENSGATGSGLLKFVSDFTTTGAGSKTVTFQGAGNTEVAGRIVDGSTGSVTIAMASPTGGGNTGTVTLSGNNTFSGSVYANTGTLVLAGSNAYTGATMISSGTLRLQGARAAGNTSGITLGNMYSLLQLRGDSATTFGNGTTAYPVTMTNASTINVDRVSGSGAVGLTIGALTTGSGNTTANNTSVFTGGNGASLVTGAVTTGTTAGQAEIITNNIAGGGSLTLAGIATSQTGAHTLLFQGSGNTIVSGAISQVSTNALSVTQSGAGTLTLAGTSAYTGATTVSSGKLVVDGAISGSTTVNTGGTLAGSGAVGSVTVGFGGKIAASTPNFSTGALSIQGGGEFALTLNTSGSSSGKVTVSSLSLDAADNAKLTLSDIGADVALANGTAFTLIDYTGGSWNNHFFTYNGTKILDDATLVLGQNTYQLSYNGLAGTTSEVTLLVIPEPSSWLLALGGLGILRGIQRRRK